MKKKTLSTKVLIGLAAGLFFGFMFGEEVAWFSVPGDIFIGLLQMTVLPYIMISLIVNIGRLSLESGKELIKYGLIFLMFLVIIGLFFLVVLPLAFPTWESGSFYSNDFVQQPVPFDFVKNYIPANPFASLSNNAVPAVVLFSIFIGLGMMKMPNKEVVLKPLDVINSALNQVNKMIVQITPIGVFCISTGIVSQLSLNDLSRLQGYLLIYLLAVVLIAFLVLPYIISIFTPFSPRTVYKITRTSLITIFVTGKIIVVLPQLIEDIKEILRREKSVPEKAHTKVDIIMPLAYPFPNLGTLMIFIFVPFAAWFTGKMLVLSDFPIFISTTLLSSFVAPITGLPFTLDVLDIPKETFQLFIVSSVFTDRIRVFLGAFHLITLTLLTISAVMGLIKIKMKKLVQGIIVVGIVGGVSIFALNITLEKAMQNIPTNKEIINHFSLISSMQPYVVLDKASPNPIKKWRGENTISRIKRRGKIRVGFYKNSIPFVFLNSDSMLVGYGVDLAHQLAHDLKVSIEFVPVDIGHLTKEMNNDYFDIIMSDIFISSRYAQEIELSKPYQNISLALLVHKENNNLNDYRTASELDTFTISYLERWEIAEEFLSYFINGSAYPIADLNEFFNQNQNDSIKFDAHLTSAERAAALTVYHPEYKLVNPLPYHINNALVFPIARDDVWQRYIDKWIEYRSQDGTFEQIYNQWILGQEYKKKSGSWSFYNNVIRAKWFSNKDVSRNDKIN